MYRHLDTVCIGISSTPQAISFVRHVLLSLFGDGTGQFRTKELWLQKRRSLMSGTQC